MAQPAQLFAILRRFASTMVDTFEMDDVLYEFGDSAATVLDAAGAGVSVVTEEGILRFVTATSETVIEIEREQERGQAGPCVEAFRTGEVVAIPSIRSLGMWPEYRETALRIGFASVVGLPMSVAGRSVGSLNVYDTREREWSDDDLSSAWVLADIATAYIVRSGQLEEAQRLSAQLQHALDSRVVIEQAKGMIALDRRISVDEAFRLLRDHARRHNRALREVAEEVVALDLKLED